MSPFRWDRSGTVQEKKTHSRKRTFVETKHIVVNKTFVFETLDNYDFAGGQKVLKCRAYVSRIEPPTERELHRRPMTDT
jgi:hypothetical protein